MTRLTDAFEINSPYGDGKEEPHVFTTVRWDPALLGCPQNTAASCNQPCPFYMLEHHWTRLQVAKWNTSLARSGPAKLLYDLLHAVQDWHAKHPNKAAESLRVKHRVYVDGGTATEIRSITRLPITSLFPTELGSPDARLAQIEWQLFLDVTPVEVSACTMYKTSDRTYCDRARASAGITSYFDAKEVMLCNSNGQIMDCSICTPYFFRNGRWVTPAAESGGQQGTTRRYALEKVLCVEDVVSKDSLQNGEMVWLSNAVRGFYRAKYVSDGSASKP